MDALSGNHTFTTTIELDRQKPYIARQLMHSVYMALVSWLIKNLLWSINH